MFTLEVWRGDGVNTAHGLDQFHRPYVYVQDKKGATQTDGYSGWRMQVPGQMSSFLFRFSGAGFIRGFRTVPAELFSRDKWSERKGNRCLPLGALNENCAEVQWGGPPGADKWYSFYDFLKEFKFGVLEIYVLSSAPIYCWVQWYGVYQSFV